MARRKHKNKTIELLLIIIFLGIIFIQNVISSSHAYEEENIQNGNASILDIYYLDVGQGDSILIHESNHNILIDAGNNADGVKLVKYFKDLKIDNFDYVIGTHAHEDHIGGLDDIIKNFEIDHFFMPEAISTSKTFEDVLDALEKKNYYFETPKEDETFKMDDISLEVLSVNNDESELNNTSIVLKLTYGKNKFLFMGDAEVKIEKELLNKDIESDVLKVGHHGSEYSTSAKFLDTVKPQYAIIEVGKDNSYGHPKDVIIKRLESRNIKIYRTDMDGTIHITSDGKDIRVETLKTDTNG